MRCGLPSHPNIHGDPIRIDLVEAPCFEPDADLAAATSILANGQNVGVLGQLSSSGFDQVLRLYESAGVVTISGSATDPSLPSFGPTVFNRTAVNDDCCPSSTISIPGTRMS